MTQASGLPTLLWKPVFEAAAQTLVGAIKSYDFGKVLSKMFKSHTYNGAMDLWARGIRANRAKEGDDVAVDALLSPYTQLFPGDPFDNATRWNKLYSFPGKITSTEYQSIEFFAGSDASLRVGSVNGESVVGLYDQYGFIGDGIVGVVPTNLLIKAIPEIFRPEFVGIRAVVKGKLARCPGQHGFVVQAIAQKAGIPVDVRGYKNVWYLNINQVKPYNGDEAHAISLLGSSWAATDIKKQQYITQYGYFSDRSERKSCVTQIITSDAWERAQVFFDEMECPDQERSFKKAFIRV